MNKTFNLGLLVPEHSRAHGYHDGLYGSRQAGMSVERRSRAYTLFTSTREREGEEEGEGQGQGECQLDGWASKS